MDKINLDGFGVVVFKENIHKITKKEDMRIQRTHDKEMAKRFGFTSHKKMKHYVGICMSNPDWAEAHGLDGFLMNKSHIKKFNRDCKKFEEEVKSFKIQKHCDDLPLMVRGKYYSNTPGLM